MSVKMILDKESEQISERVCEHVQTNFKLVREEMLSITLIVECMISRRFSFQQ